VRVDVLPVTCLQLELESFRRRTCVIRASISSTCAGDSWYFCISISRLSEVRSGRRGFTEQR